MERTKGDVKEKIIGRNTSSQKTRNEDGSSTQRRWLDEAKSNKISFDVILVSPTEKYLRGNLELDATQASTITVAELNPRKSVLHGHACFMHDVSWYAWSYFSRC